MIKAGVLGAGHLGKIHLRLLNQSDRYELVGLYDADEADAEKVEAECATRVLDRSSLSVAVFWLCGSVCGVWCCVFCVLFASW